MVTVFINRKFNSIIDRNDVNNTVLYNDIVMKQFVQYNIRDYIHYVKKKQDDILMKYTYTTINKDNREEDFDINVKKMFTKFRQDVIGLKECPCKLLINVPKIQQMVLMKLYMKLFNSQPNNIVYEFTQLIMDYIIQILGDETRWLRDVNNLMFNDYITGVFPIIDLFKKDINELHRLLQDLLIYEIPSNKYQGNMLNVLQTIPYIPDFMVVDLPINVMKFFVVFNIDKAVLLRDMLKIQDYKNLLKEISSINLNEDNSRDFINFIDKGFDSIKNGYNDNNKDNDIREDNDDKDKDNNNNNKLLDFKEI